MSTYCAPCLADLALLRESVTSVSGTAACVAHAVLLLHPGDTAQQRLARLSELRGTAEAKMATASTDDIPALELLVQEYALAGAMDMTVPLRDLAGDRTPRPPKSNNRRNRGRERDRERGPRPEQPVGETPTPETAPTTGESAEPSPPPVAENLPPAAPAQEVAPPPAPEAAAPAPEAPAPPPEHVSEPASTPSEVTTG
jgi:hypothetical protein